MKNMKKLLSVLLAVVLLLGAQAPAFAAGETAAAKSGMPFTDVEAGSWYEAAVRYAYEKGLISGVTKTTFEPDGTLTRAQLVTMLWSREGRPMTAAVNFSDVPANQWYALPAYWAASKGLAQAEGKAFDPDHKMTREEAVMLLWRYAKAIDLDVSAGEETNILDYTDALEITQGYAQAFQWAVSAGVIYGNAGKLSPKDLLTRAQAAALLQRFEEAVRKQQPLALWTEDAKARTELIAYIDAVTDEKSKDFIPVADRIAVFDMDGTLFCETDPNYFDYTLLAYRVLDDPNYKDKASAFEREVARKIRTQNETGESFAGLDVDHGKAVASAFAGMTLKEFNAYIQEFKKQPMPSYKGMTRGEGFYKPMVEVVEYLQENDFTVYIVSGTDRLIVRGIFDDNVLNIPNRQLIGSDETIVSSGQGDADGLNYVFKEGDELILGGDFLIKNLKMNKVSVIMQEIGQQPVLSFGNSTGDSSMAEYVTSGNPYRSLAFMLCCDDTARENGNVSKADKMADLCKEFGWVPVSMKNDWLTIYGDGVTYLGADAADDAA